MNGEEGSEPKPKRARICSGVDYISQLPDDIITSILSSLPLKEAAATSLVSTRWSQMWRYTPNLIFRNDPDLDEPINIPVTGEDEDDALIYQSLTATEWVNTVINSHRAACVKQFTLSFYLHHFHVIPKWLNFAISKRVETLELDFHGSPDVLDSNILNCIESSDFRSLRELKLANLETSGEAVALFVRHCPLLERLILESICVGSDLVISGSLKEFKMISHLSHPNLSKTATRFCAPNLTCLRFDSDSRSMFLESVPNLVEASVCLVECEADTMDCIANAAPKLEVLTVTLHRPKAFRFRQMHMLKKLVLDYSSVNTEFLLPITHLLQASPYLQEFSLKISDRKNYYRKYPAFETIFDLSKCGTFQHLHLEVFEFSGFCRSAADHMELLKYTVDNCVAIREIIITPSPAAVVYSNGMHRLPTSLYHRHPDVAAQEEQKARLELEKRTERLLASKVPHNIKLRVVSSPVIY